MHLAVKFLREFQSSLAERLNEDGLGDLSPVHSTGHTLPYYHYSDTDDSWHLALDLIDEEYHEFQDSVAEIESIFEIEDEVKTSAEEVHGSQEEEDRRAAHLLKEMCDLLYVIIGMSVRYKELSFLPEAFNMVHANNMLKLNEGTLDESGKLQKPPNYSPVDLTELVIRGRER